MKGCLRLGNYKHGENFTSDSQIK